MPQRLMYTLRNPRVIIGVAIGLACLILYSITMARDIGSFDVAEWQATGNTLGISHAPGSPAYTIVSYIFAQIPFGLPAARVTYVSVVVGATGVVATYVFVLLLLDHLVPALVSAATLAVAGMWWAHASVATPYNAVPAFMAILLLLLLLWSRTGNVRYLWGGALLAGVGLAYHPILMFFLPVPLAGIFLLGPWRSLLKPKPVLFLVLLFIAGLSIYLYLPIRSAAGSPIIYQKIDSFSAFMNFVSAAQARENKLWQSVLPDWDGLKYLLTAVVLKSYFRPYISLTVLPAIFLVHDEIRRRLRSAWRWLVLLAAGSTVQLFLTFDLTDMYAHHYLLLLFYFSVWAGFSIYLLKLAFDVFISEDRLRKLVMILATALFGGLLAVGIPQVWDFANHSGDHEMRNYVDYAFDKAKPDAVVLADWWAYTGFLYAQKVEGQRPDLKIFSISARDQNNWSRDIRAANPSVQILMSVTNNIYDQNDLKKYASNGYPLSFNALSYQDYDHGPPYPPAAQLFEADK